MPRVVEIASGDIWGRMGTLALLAAVGCKSDLSGYEEAAAAQAALQRVEDCGALEQSVRDEALRVMNERVDQLVAQAKAPAFACAPPPQQWYPSSQPAASSQGTMPSRSADAPAAGNAPAAA